jgi:hypothetical protein
LVAVLVLLVGALCLGLGRLGAEANAKAKAQLAADAAALAGAADGEDAARALAKANGAKVLDVDVDGREVQVKVRSGDVEAWARATGQAVGRDDAGTSGVSGLVPELRVALDRAAGLLGEPVPVSSGWRSFSEQQRLWRHRGANPYPVAPPGTSAHERGRAVDVPRPFVARLARIARRVGLCHPYPDTDPVHFELCD